LEAALSRCALVASDIPSFRELWDGVAVFFADNDADSLRDAVGRLLGDPGLRCRQANIAYSPALRRSKSRRRWMTPWLSTTAWLPHGPSAHETAAQDRAFLALAGF